MLSLGRIPMSRIGSLTLDDSGLIDLKNRPLTLTLHQLENEDIPTGIKRNLTYTNTTSYFPDLLTLHDNRLRHQPNATEDLDDCQDQMAVLSIMRSVLPQFLNREHDCGLFILLHAYKSQSSKHIYT